jgi:hypothetical protein
MNYYLFIIVGYFSFKIKILETMEIDRLFDRLWMEYSNQNTSAKKIHALFVAEGEEVLNDHVAFRTWNDKRVNIDVMARIFLRNGYEQKGEYRFTEKHLFARHYEHKSESSAPKVFISELLLEELDSNLRQSMVGWIDKIPKEVLLSDEIIFSGNSWVIPSFKVYNSLREVSEYAAWLYVYGFRANHFTISVDSLKKFKGIQEVNQFLKNHGFILNAAGGEVKGTPADYLEQSSTLADIVQTSFLEGVYPVPACYYEFAKRYPDASGKLYTGFIEKSANKIFESTDFYKK